MRAHNSRAVGAALIAACVGLSLACFREPDDYLFVVGRITDVDGAPRAGQAVTILRNGSNDCVTDFFNRPGGTDAGAYEPFTVVETNGRGDFLFELSARDARPDYRAWSGGGGGACFRARVEEQGVVAEARVVHPGRDVELTDLVLPLGGAVRADGANASFDGQWSTGSTIDEWVVRAGEEVAWRQDVDGGTATFAAEVLEDFAGLTVTRRSIVSALDPIDGPLDVNGGLLAAYVTETAPVALDNPHSVAPLSRGPACPQDADAGPCALTDGKLEQISLRDFPTDNPGMPPAELTVDLGRLATPRAVIARGLDHMDQATKLTVEGSAEELGPWTVLATYDVPLPDHEDHERFFQLQTAAAQRERGDYLHFPVAPASAVRFVRLRAETRSNAPSGEQVHPMPLFNVRELSVFE